MRSDIMPGGVFPDYQLPDHTNTMRRLSELQGDDPLILTLARGHFCPKEHQQHLQLAAFYPQIGVATPRSPRSRRTTITRFWNSARQSAPVGLSSPTQSALCSRTSTFRSTPTLNTTR